MWVNLATINLGTIFEVVFVHSRVHGASMEVGFVLMYLFQTRSR